jgi:hypothetical protein
MRFAQAFLWRWRIAAPCNKAVTQFLHDYPKLSKQSNIRWRIINHRADLVATHIGLRLNGRDEAHQRIVKEHFVTEVIRRLRTASR